MFKCCRELVRKLRNSFDYHESRLIQERAEKRHTLGITPQSGDDGRSPRALSYEQLGKCADLIEANMAFARKKALDLHKHIYNVKRTKIRACEKSSDHRAEQLK